MLKLLKWYVQFGHHNLLQYSVSTRAHYGECRRHLVRENSVFISVNNSIQDTGKTLIVCDSKASFDTGRREYGLLMLSFKAQTVS